MIRQKIKAKSIGVSGVHSACDPASAINRIGRTLATHLLYCAKEWS